MRLYDRYLIIRRAVLIAFNPNVDGVFFKRLGKDGKVYKNLVWSNKKKAADFYLRDMLDLFVEKSEDSEQLRTTVLNFIIKVQDDWNKEHPDDQIELVEKKKD